MAQPISQDLCQKCFSAQVICYSLGPFHSYFKGACKGLKREKWKGGKLAVGSERSPLRFWVLTCNLNEESSPSSVILHSDWWKRLCQFSSKRTSWHFNRRSEYMKEIQKENKDNVHEGSLFFFLPLNINLSLLLPKCKKPQNSIAFQLKQGLWYHLYSVNLKQTNLTESVLSINQKKMIKMYCFLQFVQIRLHFTEWALNANCGNLSGRENWTD